MENFLKKLLEKIPERENKNAVSDETSSFTYGELLSYAKTVSANLQRAGVKKGDRVVIEIPRCKEYVGCFLGCWIMGAVTVPLSDDYPEERLAYIKKDSAYTLSIDEKFIKEMDLSLSAEPIIPEMDADGLVIYTSGSTGNPKGVVHDFYGMTAVALRNTAHDQAEDVERNEIVGLIAPFTFIVGMGMTLAGLSLGKHLVLVPDEIRKDAFRLAKYYDDNDIQSSFVPPRLVPFMLAHNKSLKVISVGSERITNMYFDGHPVVVNGYGSTETFGGVMAFEVDKAYENTPIGKPFGKEKAYVLDDNDNEVEEGELCISGYVAKCYLNLPEQSKKVFVKNPFKERDGNERMFRTRDIVRRLPDGNIVFVERKDWMIKINGQRVEPLEIESTIRRLPGISAVAVKDIQGKNGVTYLAAYYVAEGKVTEEKIREHCKATLTSYMVPAFYIKMDALPLNPNGKLDRKNLPEPDVQAYKQEYEAPVGKIETAICNATERLLSCGKVGRKDDFFLLGGDSVKALELVSELDGLPVDLETVFAGKTPEKIAALIEKGGEDVAFDRVKKDAYPLTASQLGVYFPSVSDPGNLRYNNPVKMELSADVDVEKLIFAVEAAVNNHAAYRCRIDTVSGVPSMIEIPPYFKVKRERTENLTEALADFVKPFDLIGGELVRATLFEGNTPVLAFDAHHVTFDGTSLAVLLREIKNVYEGKELFEERTSAFEMSLYEDALKESGKYAEAKEYFTNIFDGAEFANDFPVDYEDRGAFTQGVVSVDLELEKEGLTRYLKSNGVTENSLFLAAYSYVLAKFNGSDKALVCVAESGRHTAMTFNTAGMLVRTIALPVDLGGQGDISDFVRYMQNSFKTACAMDVYPFSELANRYGLNNDFMFVFQGEQFSALKLDGREYPVVGITNPNAISRLSLMVFGGGGKYRLAFGYRSDLFRREIVESFAETCLKTVEEFVKKESLKDVEMLSLRQKTLLDGFNENKVPVPDKTVIERFNECVKKFGDRTLVVSGEKRYTYREADKIADKIARYILSLGLKKEAVSVLIPRNEWMVLATYGVLKAGCAYQPLDTTYPTERLSFMVQDSGARLLITTPELLPLIHGYTGKVLFVKDVEDMKEEGPVSVEVSPEDTFVLLYTSGTTGTPKGAMLSQKNLTALLQYDEKTYGLNENVVCAGYASFGFDAGMHDIAFIPATGGTLHIIPEEMRLDLVAVNRYFKENKITHACMTTQVARQFALMTDSPYLKHLLSGGEKLLPFDPNGKTFRMYNVYGPTECTVYVTGQEVDEFYYRVPIGKPLENVSAYIVDKQMNRLPVGVPGELLISGPQVGKGYLNLPEKTAAAFIDNPFSTEKNYEKAYRTGDVVRYLGDGRLDFIGRNDGQVKIRGFRIELSEVEGVIRDFEGVKDATVTAFDGVGGGKYLAAYVVGNAPIDLDALKKFVASKKPGYMVPEAMMQIDRIPLTQNHKVNRRALPVITKTKPKKEETTRADNLLVKKIREILTAVLGSGDFGYEDDLFEYGMNSLSVVRLSVLLNEEFGVSADVKELLDGCSIAQIESLLIRELLTAKIAPKAENRPQKDAYPLSRSQIGVYTEYLKDESSVKYNIPLVLSFPKEKYPALTAEKLKDALTAVVEAHFPLKCTVDSDKEGKFVMIPHSGEVKAETLKGTEEDLEKAIASFLKPHDLRKCVYRFTVFETENAEHLLLDIHHVMFDGASQGIFLSDLLKAISGEKIQSEKYTVFDLSTDEEEARASEKYEKAKAYYENLVGVTDGATELERDVFSKKVVPASYNCTAEDLSVEDVTRLTKAHNITFNAFFLTAFAVALSRFTYQDTVCFTTVYNGRNTVDMNRLVGMTVKTLPFVYTADAKTPVCELLLKNKEQILHSMANDVYSFSEISRELGVENRIMFVYQGETGKKTDFSARYLALSDLKSDLETEVRNDGEKFYFHTEYDGGKYSASLIRRLILATVQVAREMLKKETVGEISLLTAADTEELNALNSLTLSYDERPIIYQLAERMQARPDRTALVFGEKKYTYRDIDGITERIAAYIRSLGIGREDVVGILIPRCEYITLIPIAVLKAGAGYQPIDGSYPKERVNFMLKDSGVKLLVVAKEYRDLADEYTGEVLFFEDIPSLPEPKERVPLISRPEDLFIMLYTSGTTGVPKGVMLENRNISDFAAVDKKARDLDENTVQTAYASFGFDANLLEVISPLTNGATIHILDEDMRLDLPRLDEYFIKNKITHGFMTTQMGRQFALFTKSPYLKVFGFGGEKIVPFYREDAKFRIMNYYGPTECTCYTNYFLIDKLYERVPIGRQHPNDKVYVLDKNGNRLPIGAIGELAVAGAQVARGYLNRPEKTAEVFIKNTFDKEAGYETIYRTGDVVRLLDGGEVDIIGRNDGQVKVRGFRIELTEVEEIVRRFPGVKDVTVNAYDDPAGGKFIAAYVVSEEKVDVSELNAFILKEKPPYMVPKVTMQIDAIPLNANGKVDKRKLPVPDVSSMGTDYVPPANVLEKEFCDLFGTILGIGKVSVTDDFFALGGSSINAAQVVSFAFTKGYDLVYKNVFDNPTPRELAAFIAEKGNTAPAPVSTAEFKEDVEPVFANNVSSALGDLERVDIGNVLLFGSTGFLGIHVLKEILDHSDHSVICVIRKNDLQEPEDRLKTLLEYYFEDSREEEFGKRIFVINGDLLDADIAEKVQKFDFETVVNCAALVKHFASDDSIEKVNTGGAKNLVDLAVKLQKRLVHVSTLSVAGESVGDSIPADFRFKENMLDVGQTVDNKYTRSKYDAECEIRDAVSSRGLRAKIVRVGNLMSRSSDGEFQINFQTNNFMNTIKAFRLLECVPFDMLSHGVEFSQIDLVARAIVLLAGTNDKFNVFHVNNVHTIQMNNVIKEMNDAGLTVRCVSGEEFGAVLNKKLSSGESDVRSLNSLLAYRANRNEKRRQVVTDNTFTLDTLYRLGFCWPMPDSKYLSNLIEYLISLNFFK